MVVRPKIRTTILLLYDHYTDITVPSQLPCQHDRQTQEYSYEDYENHEHFQARQAFTQPVNWTAAFMVAFHAGAIAALFFFTWGALALAFVLWWVAGSLGIGMGYHRLLTHRGYKTPKFVEYFLTVCGTLALEGGPIAWVATHRLHHQNTDKEGDPHSPRDGGLWAHMGWIVTGKAMHSAVGELLPFVPELRKDKFHVWISKWHWVPLGVLSVALRLLCCGVSFSEL
jgi:sn-1 stearoyl-lipid 9-desaturase